METKSKVAAWDQGTEEWYCWECHNTGSGPYSGQWDSTDEENEAGCGCCGDYGQSHEFDAEIPPCWPKKIRDQWHETHELVGEGTEYEQWVPKEQGASS